MFNVQIEPTLVKPLIGHFRYEVTGVGTSGNVTNATISKNAEITQIQVNHTVGSGSFSIEIYSDSLLQDKVFSAVSDDTGAMIHFNKIGLNFQNTDTPTQNNLCYVKVIPSIGNGHSFKIALFFDKN